jgi:hypothetical protein
MLNVEQVRIARAASRAAQWAEEAAGARRAHSHTTVPSPSFSSPLVPLLSPVLSLPPPPPLLSCQPNSASSQQTTDQQPAQGKRGSRHKHTRTTRKDGHRQRPVEQVGRGGATADSVARSARPQSAGPSGVCHRAVANRHTRAAQPGKEDRTLESDNSTAHGWAQWMWLLCGLRVPARKRTAADLA